MHGSRPGRHSSADGAVVRVLLTLPHTSGTAPVSENADATTVDASTPVHPAGVSAVAANESAVTAQNGVAPAAVVAEECPLGDLRVLRAARGLSLNEAAKRAGMSPAYLQKLERGLVDNPSPHKLFSLARVLHYDYAKLMELAGYPNPASGKAAPQHHDCGAVLEEAARAADIDRDEAETLAALAFELKAAKQEGVEITREMLTRFVRTYRAHQARADDLLDDVLEDLD